MSDIKITDLVDQAAIDKIKELNREMVGLLDTYTNVARELARGVDINVKVVGDIDKLERLLVEKSREAAEANTRLNEVITEQGKVIANTTNTISRELMERERRNKLVREEYTDGQKVKQMTDEISGSYERHARSLTLLEMEIKKNKKEQKDLADAFAKGSKTQEQYISEQTKLVAKQRELAVSKSNLTQLMKIEEKLTQDNEGSYSALSHQLELLKNQYKTLTEDERNSPLGQEMERSIQDLDAHLKDMAADMGEFQRNVGNYAIAGQNGVVATESLNAVLSQQATTMQDVADQTKILEEAKRMLDTNDEHYQETLAAINTQLEENKAKLADVSDIMEKDATTAAEAEAQNKRLQEAMKHVDLSAEDAQEKIDALNAKIEKNQKVIDQATPSTKKLADEEKKLAQSAKEAASAQGGMADNMLNLLGVNNKFGSSLINLQSQGGVFEGLKTKVGAFGKTLMGLVSNPYVLALLGIAGVVAGFKWWYDYNKGLTRASLLTKDFTKLAGDDMRAVRTEVQTLAETMGKGFDETIGAANTLANQFGISWNETMQIMRDGVVLGADMHGNMIANIEKYAGAFKDAGIAADEFMAILVNTKDGLFDEKALKGITDAGIRIRSMSQKTQQALEDIGISGQKMQKDLEAGNITMVEAIQQVTDKLQELPPNAQEVGAVMKDVFGKKSAMAGEEVIQSISGINTSLEEMKAGMSDVQKLNEEQIKTQNELNETIAAMFDMTGDGFEKMTKSAKLYVTKGILAIVKGVVDVINWFIRLYNKSLIIRGAANAIGNSFKTMWEMVKLIFKHLVDSFKSFGTIIEGVFTLDWDLIQKGYKEGMSALKSNVVNTFKNIGHNSAQAFNNTLSDEIQEINPNLATTGAADKPTGNSGGSTHSAQGTGWDPNADKKSKAAEKEAERKRKAAEKAAQEELKRIHELEEAKIGAMAEGHEKELALIRQKFKKKIDEIKGEGATQTALRVQLAEQCAYEVAECERKYQEALAKINLANRLAAVKKGSKEEYDLKTAQLIQQRDLEIAEAAKTGADVNLIKEKYLRQQEELDETFANEQIKKVEERYATSSITRDKKFSKDVNALKEKYSKEMALAAGNAAKQEEIKRQYEKEMFDLETQYAHDTAQASIDMIEEILKLEGMSAEDRLKWEQELARARIALADEVADANKESVERQVQDDERLRDKRKENILYWLGVASDAIGAINDLSQQLFDNQISRIEKGQEANQEAGDKEQEHISELVAKKVITEEEGEARKRAAAAQTAKKNEEFERKKAQLKRKAAIFDKANSLAQAGIATAVAITEALPNVVLAAIAGAMGAIQIATILATPIPQYAQGTEHHRGGPAIVGDGGQSEVVMYGGKAFLTPDSPTLVDLPTGAVVLPSVADFSNEERLLPMPANLASPSVVVHNDYKDLQREMSGIAVLIKKQTYQQHVDNYLRDYELLKNLKI